MEKYFEHNFDHIPADFKNVSYSDVWTVNEYIFNNNETVKVNKFGFDPKQTGRYLPDEYWMMSDDLRYWDKAQNAMKKYDKLIKLFPEKRTEDKQEDKKSSKKKYKIIENEGKVIKENNEPKGRVKVHIISSSSEYICMWNCETINGKQFLAFFGDEPWYPNKIINTIASIDILNQKLYEIDGKKIAVVQAWRY